MTEILQIGRTIKPGSYLRQLALTGRSSAVVPLHGPERHARVDPFFSSHIDKEVARQSKIFWDITLRHYDVQPASVYRIDGATLLAPDGVVLYDGVAVRDTVHHIPYWNTESMIASFEIQGGIITKQQDHRVSHLQSGFIGYTAAWRNYAHWMSECVPKIAAWRRLGDASVPLLLPRFSPGSFQAQTLSLMDIEDAVHLEDQVVTVGEAYVASEIDIYSVSSRVTDAARLLFGKDAKRAIGDRVYIHRIGSSRRVRNFGQIEPVLKRLGFSIAVFDDVPLTQQIAAMSAAEYVIGEHGAGMANVQFCQPGTPVLEMFNPSCIQPHFWSVASARGLRYGFIAGAHANGGTPGWNTDYIVDPGALEQAVDAMRSIPRKMPATC